MRKVDIRGLIQPFSFLIISKAFKEVQDNETLEILLSGPNAAAELFKILPASSYAMLLLEKQKNDAGIRLQLKKIVTRHGGAGSSRTGNLTDKK